MRFVNSLTHSFAKNGNTSLDFYDTAFEFMLLRLDSLDIVLTCFLSIAEERAREREKVSKRQAERRDKAGCKSA